jgi:hypothetical protein
MGGSARKGHVSPNSSLKASSERGCFLGGLGGSLASLRETGLPVPNRLKKNNFTDFPQPFGD